MGHKRLLLAPRRVGWIFSIYRSSAFGLAAFMLFCLRGIRIPHISDIALNPDSAKDTGSALGAVFGFCLALFGFIFDGKVTGPKMLLFAVVLGL